MFTRNFDNLMLAICGYVNSTTPTIEQFENGTIIGFRNVQGTMKSMDSYTLSYTPSYGITNRFIGAFNISSKNNDLIYNYDQPLMILGTNNAEETYNDYTMTADTLLTMNNYSSTNEVTESGVKIINSKQVINNTENDITINEIGFTTAVFPGQSRSRILIYRKKLDTPINVTAGGIATITLTINIGRANEPTTSEVTFE